MRSNKEIEIRADRIERLCLIYRDHRIEVLLGSKCSGMSCFASYFTFKVLQYYDYLNKVRLLKGLKHEANT